jgi:hypothetical protein
MKWKGGRQECMPITHIQHGPRSPCHEGLDYCDWWYASICSGVNLVTAVTLHFSR